MRNRNARWITALAVLATVGWHGARAATSRAPCDDSVTQRIPPRPADAAGGRAFADALHGLSDDEREARIRRELFTGNIPQFLRRFVPIRLEVPGNGKPVGVVLCAAPDYLAIGSDEDFLLMPMRLGTALSVAAQYGFTLPTPRMVDAIYGQADVHVAPQPLPASSQMRSTAYSLQHNELIGAQRAALGASLGDLIAGDKKDLVLTNRLRTHPDRVAIYGWHTADGKPIQSLSTVHGWRYADYSHGARLISNRVFINGIPRSIFSVLQNERLARAVSSEGVIADVQGLIETLDAHASAAISAALQQLRSDLP
jgi:hypothetical protein